jgi:hypothetical protein
MDTFCRTTTCFRIPRTSILSGLFQHFQIYISCRKSTCFIIPRTIVLSCPFQHFEMTSFCRQSRCFMMWVLPACHGGFATMIKEKINGKNVQKVFYKQQLTFLNTNRSSQRSNIQGLRTHSYLPKPTKDPIRAIVKKILL